MDLLTYAGDLINVSEVENHPRYTFVQGDICDRNFIEELFQKYQFHDVIHFAAESHVDNSISGPEAFIKTNVLGTFNLLDTARKLWMFAPNQYNPDFINARFHHVSTDEVYGTLGETGLFEETTPYAPNSPYSAVIPKWCLSAMKNSSVEIFGDGEQLRDFTYVGDVVRVITDSIENKASYESPINLAFNQKISVNEISRLLKKIIPDLQVKYLDNRKGDIRDSLSDGELINKIYPHIKPTNFEDNLVKTFEWIKINFIS